DARADALVDADTQRAGRALREGVEVGAGGVELRHDRVGVPEQEPPGVGEVDGAGAARALDEALADVPLEPRDLLADRRLRVAELAGRAVEGPRAADGLERGEVAELDPEPLIAFHDRNQQ